MFSLSLSLSLCSQPCTYLALDEVIVPVDLQHVATVACDSASGSVEKAAATSQLCIADLRLLAVNGLAGVMNTTGGR